MDKLPMSPQMKKILLSLKKTRFKQGTFQDSERNRVRSFKEDEKYLSISLSKESFQNGKIFPGNSREKEEYIQRESCTSSRGAVFQRRGSWIVPKHILSRSNTVAVLPLQKPGATRCSSTSFEESDEVLRPEANWLLEIHSADKVKENFEKRLKPTSASVTKKPSSSDLFQRHSLGQTKTWRVEGKAFSAVLKRGATHPKIENMWEHLADQRKLLINKWLSPQNRWFYEFLPW